MSGSSDSYHAASIIVFAVLGIFLGSVLEIILKNFNSPIPYTVLLFYLGAVLSAIVGYLNITLGDFLEVSTVSADVIVYGFLPALLFSETMNLNWHHVTQTFGQAVLLAGPGGVIVCMLLAVCAYGILPFDWGWYYCFLFGAILCATDPVSVVSLLKSTKASSKLTMTISGESLLNDGSAMILYLFFFKMINGKVFTFPTFLAFVAEMLILSPAIGFVFGMITSRLMRKLVSPTSPRLDIQLLLTFICGYGSFFVAQYVLEVSGVLACCTAGVVVSLFAPLKVLADHQFHVVWENVEWGCNTLIFLLAGFIGGGRSASQISGPNIGYLFIFYVILIITRGIMMFMLIPGLNRIGQQFSNFEGIFATYAGLRGALCIALALSGADNASDNGRDETGEQLFFMVVGLASLTLLINGSSAGVLLLKLKLVDDPNAPVSPQLQQVLVRIRLFLRMYLHRELGTLKGELGHYNEQELFRLCALMRPELGNEENDIEDGLGADGDQSDEDDHTESKNHKKNTIARKKNDEEDEDDDEDDQQYARKKKPALGAHQRQRSNSNKSRTNRNSNNEADILTKNAYKYNKKNNRRLSLGPGDAAINADLGHISMRISSSMNVDHDLLTYTRETFLNVIRARYQDSIENGKIGTSSASSKLLLHSLDVAMDDIHTTLADWKVIEESLHPNPILVQLGSWIDRFFYCFGLYTGCVSHLDAYYERIAMYVLTNYIDAHEYAQARIHFFLGGMIDGTLEDIAAPEERQVLLESECLIAKARDLLSGIDSQDLLMLYTHRAAKVIIHKQGEMLEHMVKEGIISEKNARSLFENYENERNQLEVERSRKDKDMLKGNITKKIEEEKELRESMSGTSPFHNGRPSFLGKERPSMAAVNMTTTSSSTTNNTNNSNNNKDVSESSTSPTTTNIHTTDEIATNSSASPEVYGRKSVTTGVSPAKSVPIYNNSHVDSSRASIGGEQEMRGSFIAGGTSLKRGDGIFSRINNNNSNINNTNTSDNI